MIEERAHLLPLTEQGFELMEVCFPRVDGLGCVRVRTNLYSVPAQTWEDGRGAALPELCGNPR